MIDKNELVKINKYLKVLTNDVMIDFIKSTEFVDANTVLFKKVRGGIVVKGLSDKGETIYDAKFYPYHCKISGKIVKGISEITYKQTYGSYMANIIAKLSILGQSKLTSEEYINDYNQYHENIAKAEMQASKDAANTLVRVGAITRTERKNLLKGLAERRQNEENIILKR